MNIIDILQNEYANALVIILISFIIAKAIILCSKKYVKKFTEKTKTDIDDKLIAAIEKPTYSLILLVGAFLALRTITALASVGSLITTVMFILGVFIVTLMFSRIVSILITHWFKTQKDFQKTPKLISKTVSVIIYIIAAIIVLDNFNVAISPILATLGVGGLAVGLALQPTLSDLFSGINIISDKPLRVGDFIELDAETRGTVEDIGWRSTRIKTTGNTIIIIPNSKLASSIIYNISLPEQEVSCVIACGVSYGEDLERVEKIGVDVAKKILKKIKGAVKDYEPKLRFYEFGDSNINFKVILRAETRGDKFTLTHEFIKALKKEFDKKNIEISYPIMKIVES